MSVAKCICQVCVCHTCWWLLWLQICAWALEALDRMLKLLEHLDKPSTSGYAASLESQFIGSVGRVVGLLFAQMGDKLRTKALRRIEAWLGDNSCLPNVAAVARLLSSLSENMPEAALKLLLPKLASRATSGSVSDTSLAWYIELLAGLVRHGGSSLVPFVPDIRACVDVAATSEDKDVRVAGGKLLRFTLRAMSEIYVTEQRSLPPAEWAKGYHWHKWGVPSAPMDKVDVAWHVPSAEERAASHTLFEAYGLGVIARLRALMEKEEAEAAGGGAAAGAGAGAGAGVGADDGGSKSKVSKAAPPGEVWKQELELLCQAVRGAAAILPSRPGPDGDEGILAVGRGDVVPAALAGAKESLREQVLQFYLQVSAHLRKHHPSDTKCFVSICSVCVCTCRRSLV